MNFLKKVIGQYSLLIWVVMFMGCATTFQKNTDNKIEENAVLITLEKESKAASYVQHNAYGWVAPTNSFYTRAVQACKESVYREGVMINGSLSTNSQQIDSYLNQLKQWLTDQKDDRSDGIAVKLPTQYHSAWEVPEKVKQCVSDRGWDYSGLSLQGWLKEILKN